MDARDFIDELMLQNGNMESLFEILRNSIICLDQRTYKSRERTKILNSLNQFEVILQSMERTNKEIDKKLNALWNAVIKLEERNNA